MAIHQSRIKAKPAESRQNRRLIPAASLQAMFVEALRHHRAGHTDQAAPLYRRVLAIDARHADSLHLLGLLAYQAGQYDSAIKMIGEAIVISPGKPWYHCSLGTALEKLGRHDQAIECYRAALDLQPDLVEGHFNLGNAIKHQGRLEEAAICYRTALALRPDYREAYNNLGDTLRWQGKLDDAVACFQAAIALQPDYLNALNNLGGTFAEQGHLDEAITCFRRAIGLKPNTAEAHRNLGTALRQQGHLDQAVASHRKAIALQPDSADAHHNLAIALLATGNMTEGWTENEWRWKTAQLSMGNRGFAQPQWRGEPAAGLTLLIHAEQGFGDTIQFCRYAPMAAARGLRIILLAPRPLVRLLQTLARVDQVVAEGDPLPPFDLHCPMLSLPLAFGTTLETVPGPDAYLAAEPAAAAVWRDRLARLPHGGVRVGLVWAGNPRAHSVALVFTDRRRSLAPSLLAPLLDIPGCQFFSLQKDRAATPHGFILNDHMNQMADFADTAALVANLDLVISVDTAVAHLAAALGKPVWLLERFDSCWRWLNGRRDSPWYPSVRLYRQTTPGAWDSVLAEVAKDLSSFVYRNLT